MRRSHDGFQNWVSHWLKVARIPHRGGAKGRPNTCKGMFSQECAQLVVPRKDGETDEEYEDRREKLLNSIIADICIDLRHTELGDPTKELKALLGYQHLVDFKTLLPRPISGGRLCSPSSRQCGHRPCRGPRQRR